MKRRDEPRFDAGDLLNFRIADSAITENGLRQNINVALQYLNAWLQGTGAVAIFNLMEDAATAEISRAQLWQWLHHPKSALPDGRRIDSDLYMKLANEEMYKIHEMFKEHPESLKKLDEARALLDQLVLTPIFPEFLTLIAYEKLENGKN
jgi:malate synthase